MNVQISKTGECTTYFSPSSLLYIYQNQPCNYDGFDLELCDDIVALEQFGFVELNGNDYVVTASGKSVIEGWFDYLTRIKNAEISITFNVDKPKGEIKTEMFYTTDQINEFKTKAEKWDNLIDVVDGLYEGVDDDSDGPDLDVIGEAVCNALGLM